MTAQQLCDRVLELIREWQENEQVKQSETAFMVLNALAGDIMVIDVAERGGGTARAARNAAEEDVQQQIVEGIVEVDAGQTVPLEEIPRIKGTGGSS